MSKIIIITDSKDTHADRVISYIPKKLVNRINLDFYEKTFLSSFEFDNKFKIKVNSLQIKSFFLRTLFVDQNDIIRKNNLDDGFKNYISQQRNESFKNFLYLIEKEVTGYNTLSSIEFARSKILQIKLANHFNIEVPKTYVGNNYEQLKKFIKKNKYKNQLIIKPLINIGWYKKRKFYNINPQFFDLKNIKRENFNLFPVIIQEYIEKEFEYRITIVNKKFFICRIDNQKSSDPLHKLDFRNADISQTPHEISDLPSQFKNKLLKLMNYFKLNIAAIDVVLGKDNKFYFLEINPMFEWLWIELLTGMKISKSIANALMKKDI